MPAAAEALTLTPAQIGQGMQVHGMLGPGSGSGVAAADQQRARLLQDEGRRQLQLLGGVMGLMPVKAPTRYEVQKYQDECKEGPCRKERGSYRKVMYCALGGAAELRGGAAAEDRTVEATEPRSGVAAAARAAVALTLRSGVEAKGRGVAWKPRAAKWCGIWGLRCIHGGCR